MTIALPELDICSGAISSSRRYKYVKALDNRKHEIRGLWRRLDRYYAWITVEDDAGRKSVKWVPLNARTTVEARQELEAVKLERKDRVQDGRAGRLPEMRGPRARCEGAGVAGKPPADGLSRSMTSFFVPC